MVKQKFFIKRVFPGFCLKSGKTLVLLAMLGFLTLIGEVKAQQTQIYSQYMFNMLTINPAYAGFRGENNLTMIGRVQWVGVTGAPKTAVADWDKRSENSNVGYGFGIYSDKLGIEQTMGAHAFYSYYIPFEGSYLAFGLSAGVLNYQEDPFSATSLAPVDPSINEKVNAWLPTAGCGMLFATPKWYIGLSAPALLRTNKSLQRSGNSSGLNVSNHYFLTAGSVFSMSDVIKFKPSLLFKYVAGSPFQFDASGMWWFLEKVGVGVSYRYLDAAVGLFEMQLSKTLRLGYSYDYTLSDFRQYSKGSHEVMLRFTLPNTGKGEVVPKDNSPLINNE